SISDPYTNTLTHVLLSSQATAATPRLAGTVVNPGHYNGRMSVETRVDLTPGEYYITGGDFSIASGATVTCTTCLGADGVTIVLTSTNVTADPVGNFQIASGAHVTLRAPSSGTFSGILF